MELVYNISNEGTLTGIYNDFLSKIDGDKNIKRISDVEYNKEAGGWVIEILHGKYKGCFYPKVFLNRNNAIEAEILFFNKELFEN